jgi:hypothetical protein
MEEARMSSGPERQRNPKEGLFNVFRLNFKQAFVMSNIKTLDKSHINHPSNENFVIKNGVYLKRGAVAIEDLDSFTIMLKIPEPSPLGSFDNSEEIRQILIDSGLGSHSLENTTFIVHTPITDELDEALTDAGISENSEDLNAVVNKINFFIIQFIDSDNVVTYALDSSGIWPLATDLGEGIDIDSSVEELLRAEEEFGDIDEELKKINLQHELAKNWLNLFEQMNLAAFH